MLPCLPEFFERWRLLLLQPIQTLQAGTVLVGSLLTARHVVCQTIEYESALQLSDPRLKTNVVGLDDLTGDLLKLSPVQFQWKQSGQRAIGFLADQVQRLLPGCVRENAHGTRMIDESALVTIAIQALKKNQALVEDMQGQLWWLRLAVAVLGAGLACVAALFVVV